MATKKIQCECGRVMGEQCAWQGPRSQTVLVEWMPEQYRGSHTAAGNRGVFPANGAERLRLERSCAERLVEADPEWTEIME